MGKLIALLVFSIFWAWGLQIGVSIPPEKYIVEAIGGNRVKVKILMPPGVTPATFNPSIQQLLQFRDINLYFTIGLPFENKALPKLQEINPKMKIVDMGHYVKREVRNGVVDPHIWLSPALLMVESEKVLEELIKIDPKGRDYYIANFHNLILFLLRLEKQGFKVTHKAFITFHPSYGYFAENFGLKQIAIESQQGAGSLALLNKIIEEGKKNRVRVVFIAPEFPRKFAQLVAQRLGARIVVVSPLANPFDTISTLINNLK
jgi:zinc transport system substrate-binding protein